MTVHAYFYLQLALKLKAFLILTSAAAHTVVVGADNFLGVRKDFCPNFPKLAQKFLGHLLCKYFLMRPYFGWPPTKTRSPCDFGCHVFQMKAGLSATFFNSKHVGRHFLSNQKTLGSIFAQIYTDFARFFRDFARFSPNQNFWGWACNPASYTTTAANLMFPIIG